MFDALKGRIIAVAVVPCIALAVMSGIVVSGLIVQRGEMGRVEELAGLATRIGAFVHEAQRERAASVVFLGQKDGQFAAQLKAQRLRTDERLRQLAWTVGCAVGTVGTAPVRVHARRGRFVPHAREFRGVPSPLALRQLVREAQPTRLAGLATPGIMHEAVVVRVRDRSEVPTVSVLAAGIARRGPRQDPLDLEPARAVPKHLAGAAYWAAYSLDNIGGPSAGSVAHPTDRTVDKRGRVRPRRVKGPVPDLSRPGLVIPPSVERVWLLGDGDSDRFATETALRRGAARYRAARPDREVFVAWAPADQDFNDVLRAVAA